jgi:hypothetical protein
MVQISTLDDQQSVRLFLCLFKQMYVEIDHDRVPRVKTWECIIVGRVND